MTGSLNGLPTFAIGFVLKPIERADADQITAERNVQYAPARSAPV